MKSIVVSLQKKWGIPNQMNGFGLLCSLAEGMVDFVHINNHCRAEGGKLLNSILKGENSTDEMQTFVVSLQKQ